ncbi:MAG: hypothetical protein AB7I29_14480 [Geobacter sp.]
MKSRQTVSGGSVTPSQPGISVSVRTGGGPGARLSVTRHYLNLTNCFGGKGRIKSLDGDGIVFADSDRAWAYAFEHGYIKEFFRKWMKCHHAEI